MKIKKFEQQGIKNKGNLVIEINYEFKKGGHKNYFFYELKKYLEYWERITQYTDKKKNVSVDVFYE